MTDIKSIILAGGSGTRLWPLSREMYPKQFLKFGSTSLFQETVLRCLEEPPACFGIVLRHAPTTFVQDTQVILRLSAVLLGGFAVPLGGLCILLRHPAAALVEVAEIVLCPGEPSIRRGFRRFV